MDLIESPDLIVPEEKRHPWELVRALIVQKFIIKYFSRLKNITTVDIGCGDVFLLNKVKQLFPYSILIGIDSAFTESKIQLLKEHYTSDNFYFFNSIEEISNLNIKADIVLFLDVLEHIELDSQFLKKTCQNEWIDSQTVFLITVPAFNFLYNNHDRFLGHFRRYSNKTLKGTLENSGLEIIELGYFFFSLLPFRLIDKLLEIILPNLSRNSKGIGSWKGNQLVTHLIITILKIDFTFSSFMRKLHINIPGLSNFAICRIRA